jgi:hypothetical protein
MRANAGTPLTIAQICQTSTKCRPLYLFTTIGMIL